jgi:hypothetical protein
MASRVKHGWSALQNAFTALKFSTTIEDALMATPTNHLIWTNKKVYFGPFTVPHG